MLHLQLYNYTTPICTDTLIFFCRCLRSFLLRPHFSLEPKKANVQPGHDVIDLLGGWMNWWPCEFHIVMTWRPQHSTSWGWKIVEHLNMFVHQGGKKNGDFSMFQAVSITSTWNSRGWNNFGLLHGEWNLGTLQMGKKNWIGTTKNLSYEKYPTGYFPLNLGWLIGILSSWFIIVPR